jgi:hypothetical protein
MEYSVAPGIGWPIQASPKSSAVTAHLGLLPQSIELLLVVRGVAV